MANLNNNHALEIYCDGACSGNPGPGGWGAVLICNEIIQEISGYNANTTNNRMEMQAAISALLAIKKNANIIIHTDSTYLQQGITKWIIEWKKNNWKNGKIKNIDLWQQLDILSAQHNITWKWVKGHSGDKYNELADKLAKKAIQMKNSNT